MTIDPVPPGGADRFDDTDTKGAASPEVTMDDAILSDNDRKAELSFAYLVALAAHAGYTCQRGPQPDVASVDATIRSGDETGTQFDVQLKATSTPFSPTCRWPPST